MRSRWSASVYDHAHRLDRRRDRDPAARRAVGAERRTASRGCSSSASRARRPTTGWSCTLSRGNSGWVPRASVVFLTAAHVRTGRGARRHRLVQRLRAPRRRPGRSPPPPCRRGRWGCTPTSSPGSTTTPSPASSAYLPPTSCSPASRSGCRATRRGRRAHRRPRPPRPGAQAARGVGVRGRVR